ncbi:MAG: ribosome biogenesis GTPase Der [Planctomycetota bacterium]|jgi:GTP-binding protein
MPLPFVAIVGRPNVGKSTLFNALLRRRAAIVDPTAGTTRDRVAAILHHRGRAVELVDTGGVGVVDEHRLEDHINAQIDVALADAALVVFVVDVREGITALDKRVAGRLRKMNKPIILAVNKADGNRLEMDAAEFHRLGLGDPMPVSAKHLVNTFDVLDRIFDECPETAKAPDDGIPRIALLGRRNAGKSTFLNALAGDERVIASEIPGTTRDAVDVRIQRGDKEYLFIDTAGIVKKTREDADIDFYSQVRSVEAVDRCTTALLLLDIQEKVEQADKKVAAMIADACKPVVLVGNKWDRSRADPDKFDDYFRKAIPNLAFAPLIFTSAKEAFHVWEAVDLAVEMDRQARIRVPTAAVNKLFAMALEERTPRAKKTKVPKIYYASQVSVAPPTFAVFVNDSRLFPANYRRFLQNRIRKEFPFSEVPVRLLFRNKENPKKIRPRRQGL